MPETTYIYVAQIVSSLILASVLFGYFLWYRQQYLRDWAFSFFSLALYFVAVVVAMILGKQGIAHHQWPMMTAVLAYLIFGYLQITLLLTGILRVTHNADQWLPRHRYLVLIAIVFAIAFFLPYATDEGTNTYRLSLRIGMRYLLGGLAFLTASALLFAQWRRRNIGWNIVCVTFFIYGVELSFLAFINAMFTLGLTVPGTVTIVRLHGLVELVLYPTIGTGLIIWLLHYERQRLTEAVQELQDINRRDALTGIANEQGFFEALTQWFEQSNHSDKAVHLLLVGVNRFKIINESHGIRYGDQLLRAIAARIKQQNVLASGRMIGDEFLIAMLVEKNATQEIRELHKKLAVPYQLDPHYVELEFSVGWCVTNRESLNKTKILEQLNTAYYHAKTKLPERIAQFSDNLSAHKTDWLALSAGIRAGLIAREFCLHLQPIWDLRHHQIVSFEALARWQHPHRGLLPPSQFLPYLNYLNLSREFDDWLFNEVCIISNTLKKRLHHTIPISINLSAESLADIRTLRSLTETCYEHSVLPKHIVLELTESVAMQSIEAGSSILTSFSERGFSIAIDDFGTGYSSLTYLTNLPSEKIKFDRSFVTGLKRDTDAYHVMNAMINLCHKLGKRVIAEGVEQLSQSELLKELGCDEVQGFFYARPAPLGDIAQLLTRIQRQVPEIRIEG